MAAACSPNEDVCLISKGLYRIVSDVIGQECLVKFRREMLDIVCAVDNCVTSNYYHSLCSGSIAEGFELPSTDVDLMFLDKNVIVLNSNSCHLSNIANIPTVLLMETGGISLGFALLRCLKYDYRNKVIYNFLMPRGRDVYFSSRLVRENFFRNRSSRVHGPCASGILFHLVEYDFAYTLKCPYWPEQALPFIHRSLQRGWPNRDVLINICAQGCLLVPINSKQQTCNELIDLEWRISFSLAEKKLIFSMNHSQFLCYGLAKLFLNEILKNIPEIKDLLCSYFMKTAVFWEISENNDGWSPLNFISKFWNVFRRIIKWVATGYCPNFFIPGNNMFYAKIIGAPQRNLMTRLRTLYDEGYLCLQHCVSMREKLSVLIHNPFLSHVLAIYAEDNIHDEIMDRKKVLEIAASCTRSLKSDFSNVIKSLYNTTALLPSSEETRSALKMKVNYLVQRIAIIFYSAPVIPYQVNTSNKCRHKYIHTAKTLFRKTKSFIGMSEMNHASCAYLNGEYKKTIQIVDNIKQRLQRQPFMYMWNPDDNLIMECRLLGMSHETIVKKFVIGEFRYKPDLSIEELRLEGYSKTSITDPIYIPPLVFLNFLLFLSYTRLKYIHDKNKILSELQTLLWYDDYHHIYRGSKAISWEILGICQQLCGDYHGAYQSYINALHDDYNEFIQATIVRIISLLFLYKLSTDTTRL